MNKISLLFAVAWRILRRTVTTLAMVVAITCTALLLTTPIIYELTRNTLPIAVTVFAVGILIEIASRPRSNPPLFTPASMPPTSVDTQPSDTPLHPMDDPEHPTNRAQQRMRITHQFVEDVKERSASKFNIEDRPDERG